MLAVPKNDERERNQIWAILYSSQMYFAITDITEIQVKPKTTVARVIIPSADLRLNRRWKKGADRQVSPDRCIHTHTNYEALKCIYIFFSIIQCT